MSTTRTMPMGGNTESCQDGGQPMGQHGGPMMPKPPRKPGK